MVPTRFVHRTIKVYFAAINAKRRISVCFGKWNKRSRIKVINLENDPITLLIKALSPSNVEVRIAVKLYMLFVISTTHQQTETSFASDRIVIKAIINEAPTGAFYKTK